MASHATLHSLHGGHVASALVDVVPDGGARVGSKLFIRRTARGFRLGGSISPSPTPWVGASTRLYDSRVALQTLGLNGCTSLAALPEAIGACVALQLLDLTGCTSLAALPDMSGVEGLMCVGA